MTERLPNLGETSWGNILGANDGSDGFLRVSHNDDGTQLYPGASYLIADIQAATGNTDGGTFFETFVLNTSVGTDFAIDGGDATKINFAADCWVIISSAPEIGPDTALVTSISVDLQATPPVTALKIAETQIEAEIGPNGWYQPITTPPVFIPAGTVLQLNLFVRTSAGTWSEFGETAAFQIVRVA